MPVRLGLVDAGQEDIGAGGDESDVRYGDGIHALRTLPDEGIRRVHPSPNRWPSVEVQMTALMSPSIVLFTDGHEPGTTHHDRIDLLVAWATEIGILEPVHERRRLRGPNSRILVLRPIHEPADDERSLG